jgi:hypothetical protein
MLGPGESGIEDADRRQAIDRLKSYAGPGGPLSLDAYTERVARVYRAQTHAGLDEVLADLVPEPPLPGANTHLPPPPGWVARPTPSPLGSEASTNIALGALIGVIVSGVLVVIVLLLVLGPSKNDDSALPRRPVPQAPRHPTTTRDREAPSAPTTSPSIPVPEPVPDFEPAPELVLAVGADIAPGRYLTTTAEFACYWERVSGLGGSLDEIIVNQNGYGNHLMVDILESDVGFRTQGCGEWLAYAPPAAPATTIEDGDWLVGSDVEPGTYTSTGPPGGLPCAWERASDFSHDLLEGIVDYEFTEAPTTVTLRAGERFTAQSCGTWTLG